ncbi:MAG: EscV/YscV/HrcV family type III secretion system export apparatus protein, partial [Firmicutes bacterium]|nr:EscV/YscV/HrcV family type III secretion system export apparatus protein [Bacillota bacterium]
LTVGDGLVSQIPALLISTATGIIITRAASENNLGQELTTQMLSSRRVLYTAGVIIAFMGLVPGLPTLPFLTIAGLCGAMGYFTGPALVTTEEQQKAEEEAAAEEARSPEKLVSLLQVDPIELEIGYGLIPLVDAAQGGDMLDRISMIRRQCALELGLLVPVIRIRDNLQLPPGAYVVKIKGIQVAKGELMVNHYLAMDAGGVTEEVEGIPTTEPAFGLDALWVSADVREHAEYAGYTVVDAPAVLATHLTEVIRSHAPELLGRQETKALIDGLKASYSAVIDELIPNLMSLGEVQKVLQNLLREGVPIRNLVTILETLADTAPLTKDTDYLTEYVREALGRQITAMYLENDVLHVLTLAPEWEDAISSAIEYTERGATISLDPRLLQSLYVQLGRALEQHPLPHPIILVAPQIRAALKHLTQRTIPKLIVLSYNEITPDIEVQAHGVVKWISNEG